MLDLTSFTTLGTAARGLGAHSGCSSHRPTSQWSEREDWSSLWCVRVRLKQGTSPLRNTTSIAGEPHAGNVANEVSISISLTAPLLRSAELYDRASCVVEGARDDVGIAQVAADHCAVAQHHQFVRDLRGVRDVDLIQ